MPNKRKTAAETLSRIYYNPTHPGAYGGAATLQKYTKLSARVVRDWLQQQTAYTIHKTPRRKFPRLPVVVSAKDEQWMGDLSDVSVLSKHNQGFRYLLCVIDCFSRYAFVEPLKSKSALAVVEGLTRIMRHRHPEKLYTDNGREFVNGKVKAFLKQKGCILVTTENTEIKASLVERFQRTLKSRLWRYFTHNRTQRYVNVLPRLVRAYNNSLHSSINMAPAQMKTPEDELTAWLFMERHRQKEFQKKKRRSQPLQIGDSVRISSPSSLLSKGYAPQFSRETFTVSRIHPPNHKRYQSMHLYTLNDRQGQSLSGRFYPHEIQKVRERSDEIYPIRRILETRILPNRKKEYLVRWEGFPASFDSWIPETNIVR